MPTKKPETGKEKEKRIKDWMKEHGHKAEKIDDKKADNESDLLRLICLETKSDYYFVKRITGG
jgi:hypothetical protein